MFYLFDLKWLGVAGAPLEHIVDFVGFRKFVYRKQVYHVVRKCIVPTQSTASRVSRFIGNLRNIAKQVLKQREVTMTPLWS